MILIIMIIIIIIILLIRIRMIIMTTPDAGRQTTTTIIIIRVPFYLYSALQPLCSMHFTHTVTFMTRFFLHSFTLIHFDGV